MEHIKTSPQFLEAERGGHHTAHRPELEALIAPVLAAEAERATDHAQARRVALEARRVKAQHQHALDPASTALSTPFVKGPITCHKCQIKCTDAEHYLSHECVPRSQRA